MVELYRWLLAQSVSSSAIVFAGDSAGCDLLYLSLLHIRDHEPKIPQPSCVVSVSPWLDWTGAKTIGHSNWHSDFMFYYDDICPALNNALRPESLPFDSPEINALLASDLSRLPPQLIYYSRHEILQSDSTRWIERSRASGVDITEQAVDGEMHTFAVGWPITSQEMQNRCDELTLRYIFEHTSR